MNIFIKECCGINTGCDIDGTCCILDQIESFNETFGQCFGNSDCCDPTSLCQKGQNLLPNMERVSICDCFPLGMISSLIDILYIFWHNFTILYKHRCFFWYCCWSNSK